MMKSMKFEVLEGDDWDNIEIHEYISTSFNIIHPPFLRWKKPRHFWRKHFFTTSRPKTRLSPSQSRKHKMSKAKSDDPEAEAERNDPIWEDRWSLVKLPQIWGVFV